MATAFEAKEKMVKRIATLTRDGLCALWEETNKNTDDVMPVIRELIMDRVEELFPAEFDAWMDCDDVDKMDDLSNFI